MTMNYKNIRKSNKRRRTDPDDGNSHQSWNINSSRTSTYTCTSPQLPSITSSSSTTNVLLNYGLIFRPLRDLTKMKQSTKALFRTRKSILMYFAFLICFFFNCYHMVSTTYDQAEWGSALLNIRDEEGKTWGVTLVTQCDISRTWILEETCRRWNGPIVVVLYVSNEERQNTAFAHDETGSISVSPTCKHATIITYFETAPEKVVNGVNVEKYPINKMRNIGIDAVYTSHFLMIDVDFVPSATLRKDIMRNLKFVGVDDALVVPAFERHFDKSVKRCGSGKACSDMLTENPDFLPSTFDEIVNCTAVGSKDDRYCTTFHEETYVKGHFDTGVDRWLTRDWFEDESHLRQKQFSDMKPRELHCLQYPLNYEPYVVLKLKEGHTPKYNENYHTYGKNKIQYTINLVYRRYQFSVLPRGFIVHFPHNRSNGKEIWRNSTQFISEIKEIHRSFLSELESKYGKLSFPSCEKNQPLENVKVTPKQKQPLENVKVTPKQKFNRKKQQFNRKRQHFNRKKQKFNRKSRKEHIFEVIFK